MIQYLGVIIYTNCLMQWHFQHLKNVFGSDEIIITYNIPTSQTKISEQVILACGYYQGTLGLYDLKLQKICFRVFNL